jgi:hypothetical protein
MMTGVQGTPGIAVGLQKVSNGCVHLMDSHQNGHTRGMMMTDTSHSSKFSGLPTRK